MIPRQPGDLFTPAADTTIDDAIASAVRDHAAGLLPRGWSTRRAWPAPFSPLPLAVGAALAAAGVFGRWFGASL